MKFVFLCCALALGGCTREKSGGNSAVSEKGGVWRQGAPTLDPGTTSTTSTSVNVNDGSGAGGSGSPNRTGPGAKGGAGNASSTTGGGNSR